MFLFRFLSVLNIMVFIFCSKLFKLNHQYQSMNKEEKAIIKHLIKRELEWIKKEKTEIEFPQLNFLKSMDMYREKLKEMDKNL